MLARQLPMRLLLTLLLPILLAARTPDPAASAVFANVNSRYRIESVEIQPSGLSKLSQALRQSIEEMIGARFDQTVVEEIRKRLRQELRPATVATRLTRGTAPENIKVVFDVSRPGGSGFEVEFPNLQYHSKQAFSFGMEAVLDTTNHRVRFGALTDNDELLERFSGVRGGYERKNLAGRFSLGFNAASWRSQWNPALRDAEVYRTRTQLEPFASVRFYEPLTLQLGVSFGQLDYQNPAARDELSSAAFLTLRFQRRWELASGNRQEFEAGYGMRIATRALAGDFAYRRHTWNAEWRLASERQALAVAFQAGSVSRRAPLYERFILGNSKTLRGWSKFDVAPLGADRMAHTSVDYRWRHLRVIYDTGAAWLQAGDAKWRHSVAIGFTDGGPSGFSALVAFPIREGRVDPIFIVGINF